MKTLNIAADEFSELEVRKLIVRQAPKSRTKLTGIFCKKRCEMKRIVIIATLVVFAQIAAGFSKPVPQTFPQSDKFRRIDVNARTITALAPGKSYIVDLTQRGMVYEFSHQAGSIDFSRVKVRTAQGEVAIGSYLKAILKGRSAGFNYGSQAFSLAIRDPGTVQNPPTGTTDFNCDPKKCSCRGRADCLDMIFDAKACGSNLIMCHKESSSGTFICDCYR